MKVICDSHIPFIRGVLEPYCDVTYCPGQEIGPETVHDADALIIRTRTRCDRSLLEGSKVRFIATATIGYDHIDTGWCESNGICWTNAPGCNSRSVQQYMGSLLVNMSRDLGFRCRDKTIGIVGVGNVGGKVAQLSALLGFRVLLCDPPRAEKENLNSFVCLEDLIRQSDIISLHVPLVTEGNNATFHLFDRERLASLDRNCILINTSRGEVIDGTALKSALAEKRITAAALDVWEGEPAIDKGLLQLLYSGTPHIAGYSADGKAAGTAMSIRALGSFFDLPCRNWEVPDIPPAGTQSVLTLDSEGKTPSEVLGDAILHTYDTKTDDYALRKDPSSFERIRSEYPVRREFPAFNIKVTNDHSGRSSVFLREAGFNVYD